MAQQDRTVKIPVLLNPSCTDTYSILDVPRHEGYIDGTFLDKGTRKVFTLVSLKGDPNDKFVIQARKILNHQHPIVFLQPNRIAPLSLEEHMFGDWTLFRHVLLKTDVMQRCLGTCWKHAGLIALLAVRPGLVTNRLFEYRFRDDTFYYVWLYLDGKRTCVKLSHKLPCVKIRGYRVLVFAGARRKQTFVSVLEKAFAGLFGTFQSIEGGHTYEAFNIYTGLPSWYVEIKTTDDDDDDEVADDLWTKLLSFKKANFAMAGQTKPQGMVHDNLKPTHSYTIRDLVDGPDPDHRLLQLHNPTGRPCWTGPWSDSDDSPARWTDELRRAHNPVQGQNGIFFMCLRDFMKQFYMVDYCKVDRRTKDWHEARFEGRFMRSGDDYRNMNVFMFEVKENQTKLEFTLHQESRRKLTNFNLPYMPIAFGIFQVEHKKLRANVMTKFCGYSGFSRLMIRYYEITLDTGRYVLLPYNFSGWPSPEWINLDTVRQDRQKFVLSVFSSTKIDMKAKSSKCDFLGDTLLEFTYSTEPVALDQDNFVWCYHKELHDGAGSLLAVENRGGCPVKVRIDASASSYTAATRGALITEDVIPSKHRQLINVYWQADAIEDANVKYVSACDKPDGAAAQNPALGHTQSIHSPRPIC